MTFTAAGPAVVLGATKMGSPITDMSLAAWLDGYVTGAGWIPESPYVVETWPDGYSRVRARDHVYEAAAVPVWHFCLVAEGAQIPFALGRVHIERDDDGTIVSFTVERDEGDDPPPLSEATPEQVAAFGRQFDSLLANSRRLSAEEAGHLLAHHDEGEESDHDGHS